MYHWVQMYDIHKFEERIDTNWSMSGLPVHVALSSHSCVHGNSPLTTMLGVWSFGQKQRSWTLLLLSTRYGNFLVCMYMVGDIFRSRRIRLGDYIRFMFGNYSLTLFCRVPRTRRMRQKNGNLLSLT